jgi:polyisoprenoid-binding protein YceI
MPFISICCLEKARARQIVVATNIFLGHQSGERSKPIMTPPTATPTTTWNIDPAHSAADFKVKHMMISNVKGNFSGLSGTLTEHTVDSTLSSVEASIPVASISTGDVQRDGHLKSAEFFDAEKFPAMTFKSTKVVSKGNTEYEVTGDLTIRGVTKAVTFAVEGPSAPGKDPWGNTRIGLSATAKINRKDFGLAWNAALETGGFLVGDEVSVTLDVEFIKAA